MEIIITVLLYEIISIGGCGLYLAMKHKKEVAEHKGESKDAFITSNRDLPVSIVGVSLALAVLGAVHVFGIMEMSWHMGAVAIWFSVAHVTLLCVVCLATGRWVRRMRVATVPELIRNLFGRKIALVCTCVIAGQTFAILTMEAQALGIVFHTLTFGELSIPTGAVIGGIIGIAYVIIAGMKEIGWVNLINTIVMYAGIIVAIIYLGFSINGGYATVQNHFMSTNQGFMTSIWGGPGMFVAFGIANIIAVTFAQGISQMGLQSAMAAKNEKTIVKALWIAAPVNGLFGVFTMIMGISAKAMYETGQLELNVPPEIIPKVAGGTMLVNLLPWWLVAWLLAAFLGAVLSTFAITTMGMGALFAKNIYTLKNPNASEAQLTSITRLFIVLSGIVAMGVSSFLPEIISGANWAFAWLCPIFWNVVFGLFWKRSRTAAGIIFAVSWILVLLWTYTPVPAMLGIGIPVPFVTLAVSIVGGVILNAALPGKISYFKEMALKKAAA